MNKEYHMSDAAVLIELGRRLAERRIREGWTQAELAKQAGIGKRTLERIEAGNSCQTSVLVRVLRILGLQQELAGIVPKAGPSPIELWRMKGKERKRASSKRRAKTQEKKWHWGDEA
ncbi:MAG: helix-turn-helix domain-containing protein [Acidobacteria bacterium]|nr:helix-turn-helix domain-containing protein [Acidobacteriota bacterium]